MRTYLVAAMLLAGAATPAFAQSDASGWSGLYGGLHAGYGFDNGRPTDIGADSAMLQNALAHNFFPSRLGQNRTGFDGGGQVGWNFRSGNLVFGPELDLSYLHERGTGIGLTTNSSGQLNGTVVRDELDWMGSARLRVGYVLGDGMFYATGGYAAGRTKGSAAFNAPNGTTFYGGRDSYVAQGWTAGLGAEIRPFHGGMSRLSFGPELTYYDLGRSHIIAGPAIPMTIGTGDYVLTRETRGYHGVLKLNYAF